MSAPPGIGHAVFDRSDMIEINEEPIHKLRIYAVFPGEFHDSLNQRPLTNPERLHRYGVD